MLPQYVTTFSSWTRLLSSTEKMATQELGQTIQVQLFCKLTSIYQKLITFGFVFD